MRSCAANGRQLVQRACRLLAAILVAACSGGDGPVTPGPGPGPGPTPDVRDTLSGAPTAAAADVVPLRVPRIDSTSFRSDDPSMPGVMRSVGHAIVLTTPTATIGDINATMRAHGLRLLGGVPGKAGVVGATLVLGLPTSTHAGASALLDTLRRAPWVQLATKDGMLEATALPRRAANAPADWSYGAVPAGGNWWLEAVRAPQLWNLNGRARKLGAAVPSLVFDVGFNVAHPESFGDFVGQPVNKDEHGTAVAAMLGARFDDASGIEGVNPFAAFVLQDPFMSGGNSASFASIMTSAVATLLARPAIRVVNFSLGYNWYKKAPPVNADVDAAIQAAVDVEGQFVEFALTQLTAAGRPLPYIVAAAGNDASAGSTRLARYSSPFCNAAKRPNGAAIICIEAAALQGGVTPYTRAAFSSSQAEISAPGDGLLLSDSLSGYAVTQGTSFASPLVAGVIGYLLAVRADIPPPTLTTNPLRGLLAATGSPATGLRPMVDAWAAAMSLDSAFGGNAVRLALVDIDDGTVDGNQRADSAGVATPGEDVDGDGGEGDGVIDMSDFRRFRDAFLFVTQPNGLALDGPAESRKRDLNGDDVLEAAAQERVHARTDFNGDGVLDEQTESLVPGLTQGPGPYTDLEVLQLQYSDPDVGVNELPALLRSGDLHLRAVGCNVGGGLTLRTETQALAGGPVRTRPLVAGVAEQIVTVPVAIGASPAGYVVRTLVTAPGDTAMLTRVDTVGVALGGDTWLQTTCLGIKAATLPQGTVGTAYAGQLSSVGGTSPGVWALSGGNFPVGLQLNANGSISGTPTAAGTYAFSVRLTSGGLTTTRGFTITVGGGFGGSGSYRGMFERRKFSVPRSRFRIVRALDGALATLGNGFALSGSFQSAFTTVGGTPDGVTVSMTFVFDSSGLGTLTTEEVRPADPAQEQVERRCTGTYRGAYQIRQAPGRLRWFSASFRGFSVGNMCGDESLEDQILIQLVQRPEGPTVDRSGVYIGFEQCVACNNSPPNGSAVFVYQEWRTDELGMAVPTDEFDVEVLEARFSDDPGTGGYTFRPGSFADFVSRRIVVGSNPPQPLIVGSFTPSGVTYESRDFSLRVLTRFSGSR